MYGERYNRREFSATERPEGYFATYSGVINHKSGAKRRAAVWDNIGAARRAEERNGKALESREVPLSGVGMYWSGEKRYRAVSKNFGAGKIVQECCGARKSWSGAKRLIKEWENTVVVRRAVERSSKT